MNEFKDRLSCFKCVHRRPIPGDAHSSCHHPAIAFLVDNPLGEVFSLLRYRTQADIMSSLTPEIRAQIMVEGHPHGIKRGWFLWPFNFDPAWLVMCTGFKPKEG